MKSKIGLVLLAVICAALAGTAAYTFFKGEEEKKEIPPAAKEDTQGNYISYEGKKWKVNPDIETVLFMGIDEEAQEELEDADGFAGQADSLNLLVLNKETKEAQMMQISRDSIVNVDVYDKAGERKLTKEAQICLQYAYGGGGKRSCRLQTEKVEAVLGGTRIDNYLSLTLDGITAAANAIGGVTLTIPKDYTQIDPAFQEGARVTLKGEQAEKYVRYRDWSRLDGNNGRMERQSQFMEALIRQMGSAGLGKDGYAAMYQEMEPYMVTSMTADELSELSGYDYEGETITLPGEVVEGGGHARYILDKEKIKEIVVKTLYKPI